MTEHIENHAELAIRHHLHAHPERSFKRYETSAYIEKLLRAHDIEILNNPLESGVVALIRGVEPGPRIALRADIDGLPIQEDTGLPFASVNDGVMLDAGTTCICRIFLARRILAVSIASRSRVPSNCCSFRRREPVPVP